MIKENINQPTVDISRLAQGRGIFWGIIILLLFALAVVSQMLSTQGFGISYQVSSSMPRGFYWRYPAKHLQVGSEVIVNPPLFAKNFLLAHHWLPNNGWLLKKIMAQAGDEVCNLDGRLIINGRYYGPIYTQTLQGEKVPQQSFCDQLKPDQYWLMGISDDRSYDSRYFGPVKGEQILSEVKKIS